MTFVKIHGTILDSSIWSESPLVCKVWITMLAMADENGVVEASVDGLARRSVVATEDCEAALSRFLGPDRFSRDGTSGERIEVVPGGWLVLNHAQYRDKRTEAQIATAARVKRHRERTKAVSGNDVTPGNAKAPSEAEADTDKKKNKSAHFDAWWAGYPRKVGKGAARVAYAKVIAGNPKQWGCWLLDTVERYRTATDAWKAEDRKYIPYPASWLNKEHYHDDPTEWLDPKERATQQIRKDEQWASQQSAKLLAESRAEDAIALKETQERLARREAEA